MPDDPRKAIEYALAFLPGFIALSVALAWSDSDLSEFSFSYISITLSVAIFLVSNGLLHLYDLLPRRRPTGEAAPADPTRPVRRLSRLAGIVIVAATTGLASIGMAVAIEYDVLLRVGQLVPFANFSKKSGRRPLRVVMDDYERCQMYADDDRPDQTSVVPERPWVRLHGDNGAIYEGFPLWHPTGNEPTEFYLSPACVVTQPASGPEVITKYTQGPGIIMLEKSLSQIDFIDVLHSGCHTQWFAAKDFGCKLYH